MGGWADAAPAAASRALDGNARILIVATFRDTKSDSPGELSEALVDLRRVEGVQRVGLSGLSDEEIAEFVRRAGGDDPDAATEKLARSISELTDGNAFLMVELWRTLTETGELASPDSVREVVSQRLSRLTQTTRDVLEVAAWPGPSSRSRWSGAPPGWTSATSSRRSMKGCEAE